MLPLTCFTCGRLLGDIQLLYEQDCLKIDNDPKMNEKDKNESKSKLLDKYHITKYCCRTKVLTYVKLIDIIT
jgi:DNA-directed RNA polymerase subunit N (RpoN/RPB10)